MISVLDQFFSHIMTDTSTRASNKNPFHILSSYPIRSIAWFNSHLGYFTLGFLQIIDRDRFVLYHAENGNIKCLLLLSGKDTPHYKQSYT